MSYRIRSALIHDIGEIARIHVACWDGVYGTIMPLGERASLADREAMWEDVVGLPGPPVLSLVVETERGIAGFLNAGPARDDCFPIQVEISAIYIDPCQQRTGLGSVLFAHGLARLMRWGVDGAYLWSPRDNLAAHEFFRYAGGAYLGEGEGPGGVIELGWGWRDLQEQGSNG